MLARPMFRELAIGPAAAQSQREADLELVLLACVVRPNFAGPPASQRQGYAEAITASMAVAAIRNSVYGSIAVAYVR